MNYLIIRLIGIVYQKVWSWIETLDLGSKNKVVLIWVQSSKSSSHWSRKDCLVNQGPKK